MELTPADQLEEEVGRADDYAARIQKALLQIRKALKPTPPTSTVVPTATPPTVVTMGTPPTVVTTATTPGVVTTATPSTIMTTSTPSTVVTTATTPTATPLHSSPPAASSKVKLPKISLPQFKGNPMYWTAFWDSYESAIHLNSTLSNVDKFNYLWSLLEKSANAGLTLSSANYIEAIEILKKQFGNKQMIVSKHMEILLNLTAVSGEHDLRGLRRLYNEVETNVRSLKALGVEQATYGAMLTSVLLTKLPPEIRLIATRKASGGDLDLEMLQRVFEEELAAREFFRDPPRSSNRQTLDKM